MPTPSLPSGINVTPSIQAGAIQTPYSPSHRSVPARPSLKRRLKNVSKRGLRTLFELGQRCGLDVLPRHFYSEIPCISDMRRNDAWKLPRSMHGVPGTDISTQFDFLESC